MSAASTKGSTINPSFTLSKQQEDLLFAALNSNNPVSISDSSNTNSSKPVAMAPGSLTESPLQANLYDDSPFIDNYDYEFDAADGSFGYDFSNDSQGQMIGNLPGTSSDGDADSHDKRGHDEIDGEDEDGGGKRREGDEKTSKKPGRKPLTSEPTSKRKAQNRAAQRAFRERKERHLKDLETKVEDLEKASESANHENSILRAQIEKMSMELREYKKRLSLPGASRTPTLGSGMPLIGKGLGGLNNSSDVNFSFEFPKFGRLPGPPVTRNSSSPTIQSPATISPRNQSLQFPASNGSSSNLTATHAPNNIADMSSLSGLFSPSLLDSVGKSPPYEFFPTTKAAATNGSRSSTDSANGSNGNNTSYSSPSPSSNSNHGASSSCGTSPEPTSMQSPAYNKDPVLTTIGEENPSITPEVNLLTPSFDINGIDWFAQQNNNQFDPQLFGDYREPQDNVLARGAFNDNFFTDAFTVPDFTSPYNVAPSPAAPKKDLVAQIDAAKEDDEVVPGEDTSSMLHCNTIWDRLQACPKVKDGDFDLDLLCKDLQKKAKCSETGAVVNESDFNKIMTGYIENQTQEKNNAATAAASGNKA